MANNSNNSLLGGDPNNISIADVLKSVATFNLGVKSSEPAIEQAMSAQKTISETTSTLLQATGEDQSVVSAAASAEVLDRQARMAKAAAMLGVDINAQTNNYAKLVEVKNQASQDRMDALAAVKEKQSVKLLDNPIQYLINGFTVHADVEKHNLANATFQEASEGIDKLNSQAQATFQTQKELAVGTTVESAAAAARVAASGAKEKANLYAIQGLQYGIASIKQANEANKEVYDALYKGFSAVNAEKSMALQNQEYALHVQQFKEHIREFNIGDEIRQNTEEYAKNSLVAINLARAARGDTPLDTISAHGVSLFLKTGKGVFNEMMQNDLAKGEMIRMTGGTKPLIATTPSDLATMMAKGIPVNFTPAQLPVKNVVASVVQSALSPTSTDSEDTKLFRATVQAAKASKDTNAINNAINAQVQKRFDSYASNVVPTDSTNPYVMTSLNALAEQSATVRDLPVYQKVFAPLAAAGQQLNNPKIIFTNVVNALAEKKISFAEALETTTMFQVGVANNLAQRNLQGVAGITPRLSYNTAVDIDPTKFSGTRVFDQTKPDEFGRALMLALKSRTQGGLLVNPISERATGGSIIQRGE